MLFTVKARKEAAPAPAGSPGSGGHTVACWSLWARGVVYFGKLGLQAALEGSGGRQEDVLQGGCGWGGGRERRHSRARARAASTRQLQVTATSHQGTQG